jgi:hypothetical protein
MRFIIAFILMLPLALLAQPVEPLIPVATIGAYGAGVGDIPTVASGATIHTHITRAALAAALVPNITLSGNVTGAANATVIANGVVTPAMIANGTSAGQVYKWNGTAWSLQPDAGTTYTAGTGIDITGVTISNTGDLSNTNELQTIATATNTVTLSNGGGAFTVAGAGINVATTSGTTITVTGTELDGNPTNEIQSVSRNVATNNVVTLSLSGGTVNVEDLFVEATATFTAGQTTATMAGTLPAENSKLWVYRNGVRHVVGASGCSGCNVTRSGGTLTFARVLATGEVVTFKYPLQ